MSTHSEPIQVDMDVYSDDTWSYTLPAVIDESLTPPAPKDLTNYTVEAWADASPPASISAIQLNAAITADVSGLITVGNPAPPLPPGTYEYNVQIVDPNAVPPTSTTTHVGTIYVRQSIGAAS